MAAPVVASRTTSLTSTAGSSHVISLPSGVAAGDLLIAVIATSTSGSATWSAGWNVIRDLVFGAGCRVSCAWRVATGSGDAPTITTGGATTITAHACLRITGHDVPTTAPVASTGVANSGTNPDPDALTPAWGSADTLWLAIAGWEGGLNATGYPSGYTNGQSNFAGSGAGGAGVTTAEKAATATSDDPGAFTRGTTLNQVAFTVGIKPSGAAATNLVVQDGAHAHATDAIALVQAHALTVADATHAHPTENVVLVVGGVDNLVVQDARSTHIVGNLTLSVPGVALRRANNAEGGSDGANVTIANSGGASGDGWNGVFGQANNDLTYATNFPRGAMGYRLSVHSNAGTHVYWDGFSEGEVYLRLYGRLASHPDVASNHIFFRSGGVEVAKVTILADGKLQFHDKAGIELVEPTPLPVGAYYRMEIHVKPVGAGTGVLGYRIATGADLDGAWTLDQSSSAAHLGTTPIDEVRIGTNPNGTATYTHYFDDVALRADDWVGPVVANLVVGEAHHAHLGDGVSISQLHSLLVADARNTHAADAPSFSAPPGRGTGLLLVKAGDSVVDGVVQGTVETDVFNQPVVGGTIDTSHLLIARSLGDVLNASLASRTVRYRLKYGPTLIHDFTTIPLASVAAPARYADIAGAFLGGQNSPSAQRSMMDHRQGGSGSGAGGFSGGNDHAQSVNGALAVDSAINQNLAFSAQLSSGVANFQYRNRGVWVEYWTSEEQSTDGGTKLIDMQDVEVIASNASLTTVYSGIMPGGTLETANLVIVNFFADVLNNSGANAQWWLDVFYGTEQIVDAGTGVDRASNAARYGFPSEIWIAGNGATDQQVTALAGHAIGGTVGSGAGIAGGGQWNNTVDSCSVDSTVDQPVTIKVNTLPASPNVAVRVSAVTMSVVQPI